MNESSFSGDSCFDLWLLLEQAREAILAYRQEELSSYGIFGQQACILWVVGALDGKGTPAEIARWLFRKPHSVSELITRMEKKGLFKRIKDVSKKNQVRIGLTDEGRECYMGLTRLSAIHDVISCLSSEERKQLASNLKVLRDVVVRKLGQKYQHPLLPR